MSKFLQQKRTRSERRARRVRAKNRAGARLRLSVFRSNRHISVQVIDDRSGRTLASASDRPLGKKKQSLKERARAVGQEIARLAQEADIRAVRFDRGRYRYHGAVKELAEGAREGGLSL